MVAERNPTRRAAEIARQQWGLALAEMDEEGQRAEVSRMLNEAVESVPDGALRRVITDAIRDLRRRT